ncbi:MAG TPA: hypothetical protein PLD84_09500 [Chitinophagales bacterium]|nr:hypothetical protein [Chitinophagales bacterium]
MDAKVETLIKMFGGNSLNDIENNIEPLIKKYFNAEWDAVYQQDFFKNNYELIRCYKKNLDELTSKALNTKDRVTAALNFCWKEANFNKSEATVFCYKMEVFHQLVNEMLKEEWTPMQKEHFNAVSQIFRDYHNYFLSYTNHLAQAINQAYKIIYEAILSKEDYTSDDFSKRNLLARAFHRVLHMRNLQKGFFDLDSIRLSQDINDKVTAHASKSIAFIQLLSKASFEYNEPNWSYIEYKMYSKSRDVFKQNAKYRSGFSPLLFYVFAEKNAVPQDSLIPDDYKEWAASAKQRLHCDLTAIHTYDDFVSEIERLINDIINFKSEMVNSIPD